MKSSPGTPQKQLARVQVALQAQALTASDSLLPVNHSPKTHHLPEKFTAAAVNGEYVDFSDVSSPLSVLQRNHNDGNVANALG